MRSPTSATLLLPESVPLIFGFQIVHRESAADVEHLGLIAAAPQVVDQRERLADGFDPLFRRIAVKVKMEAAHEQLLVVRIELAVEELANVVDVNSKAQS